MHFIFTILSGIIIGYIIFLTFFGAIPNIKLDILNLKIDIFTKLLEFKILSILICIILGILISYIINKFIIKPLYTAQKTMVIESKNLINQEAIVTQKIFKEQYGKIKYVINGNIFSAPAKSENGEQIDTYTQVKIVRIEKNTFYVKPKNNNIKEKC